MQACIENPEHVEQMHKWQARQVYNKIMYLPYSKLCESSQENARISLLGDGCYFEGMYDDTIEHVCEVAEVIGMRIKEHSYTLQSGKIIYRKQLYFMGEDSYDDKVTFDATYSYQKGYIRTLERKFPGILLVDDMGAGRFQEYQLRNQYAASCTISSSRSSETMDFEWERPCYKGVRFEKELTECIQDFARWASRKFHAEYEHITSKEYIEDFIEANEYYFKPNGEMV